MKTKILFGLLLFFSTSTYSMLWRGCKFTKLAVNNDGSWSATIIPNNGMPDSLFLVSGTDTAKFVFSDSDLSISFTREDNIVVIGDVNETKLTLSWTSSIYQADAIVMNFESDSLEILSFYDIHTNNDKLVYGGTNFLPAFGDKRVLYINNLIGQPCENAGRTYNLEIGDTASYTPYILKGKVFDETGAIVTNQGFMKVFNFDYSFSCYSEEFTTTENGSYEFRITRNYATLENLYYQPHLSLPVSIGIQSIELGKAFTGEPILVDIHLLGPLSEDETEESSIAVMYSDGSLKVSGEVKRLSLTDASGRILSQVAEADIDVSEIPSGIYYLSILLQDGRFVTHTFQK